MSLFKQPLPVLLSLTALAVAATSANADFLECLEIEDEVDRLRCYDAHAEASAAEVSAEAAAADAEAAAATALAEAAAAEAAALEEAPTAESVEPVVDTGNWGISVDQSPLTDDKTVILRVTSENTIRGRYGSSGRGFLLIRCMENTTSAYIGFNDQFMSDIQGYGRVEYRIDDDTMRRINMSASTDNMVLGLWNGGRSIPWVKQLIGHDQLIVRATPFNESASTMTFDISGLDQAITELRQTCSW